MTNIWYVWVYFPVTLFIYGITGLLINWNICNTVLSYFNWHINKFINVPRKTIEYDTNIKFKHASNTPQNTTFLTCPVVQRLHNKKVWMKFHIMIIIINVTVSNNWKCWQSLTRLWSDTSSNINISCWISTPPRFVEWHLREIETKLSCHNHNPSHRLAKL